MKVSKGKKAVVFAATIAMIAMLPGCTNGIGDTITLVKSAESAKQAIERTQNLGSSDQSVGTVADPTYKSTKITVDEFEISCDGNSFIASWALGNADDGLRVRIYADTDQTGEDGIKIASYDSESANAVKEFSYPALEDGAYYCYIEVSVGSSNPVTQYCETPIYVENTVLGYLEDVSIVVDGDAVAFSWTADGSERYRAVLLNVDTNEVIAETVIVDSQARIAIPDGLAAVNAAVASYADGEMGPYEPVFIELSNAE